MSIHVGPQLCYVSIRVFVGIAQELGSGGPGPELHAVVSIRVLVGIAQEPASAATLSGLLLRFNPCVGRNSSGASRPGVAGGLGVRFQSVCWSE